MSVKSFVASHKAKLFVGVGAAASMLSTVAFAEVSTPTSTPTSISSKSVVAALDKLQKRFTFKTITVDNGSEFADAYGMEHDKNGNKRTTIYYCHPYSSFERGSNERHNRMIRRYVPKGCDMRQYNQKYLDAVAQRLNTCPRFVLNGQTPEQLFSYYSNLPDAS